MHYRVEMLARHVIRASVLDAIVAAALEEGVGSAALGQRLGLDLSRSASGSDAQRMIPLAMTDAAWIWASRLGPEDFSLRVGARFNARTLGLLSYLLGASATVGAAFERLLRFYPVLSTGTRHRLSVRGDRARVFVELEAARRRSPRVESFAVAAVVGLLRNETEGRCRPVEVRLSQASPSWNVARAHERAFGAPTSFGATGCWIDYPADALLLPLRGADENLAQILEAHACAELSARDESNPSLRERVRACLWSGIEEASAVALELGVSARSLRRQLANEQTSFAELVAERRSAVAVELLSADSVRVADIAQRLGYAEVSSFTRAFRRWHGVSPRAFAAAAATATGLSR